MAQSGLSRMNLTVEGVGLAPQFDWAEYIVFVIMLAASAGIGIYFGCKSRQKTVLEYFLGDKNMPLIPITMSLISSHISGVTLLGVPTEVYTYGMQIAGVLIANIAVGIITLNIFLPTFYKLQLLSIFEYQELRFNKSLRIFSSLLFTVSLVTFIPIVIYGPALVFNQVSGLNIHIIAPLISLICIFYTTLGGLKAVVWTDSLQGVFMMFSILAILVLGFIRAGGVGAVYQAALDGGRLEVFDMDISPTARLTFWSSTVGFTFILTATVAAHPGFIQRFMSLPTYKQAKESVWYFVLGTNLFFIPSMLLGLIMYAMYKDCDPYTAKVVSRPDQILPYFVMDVAGSVRGLSGLFAVGICSASLSTMSTGLNTVAGILVTDFVEPCFQKKLSDEQTSIAMKIVATIAGVICVLFVSVIDKLGPIFEILNSFGGAASGISIGVFTLGILFPTANAKGALTGAIVGVCFITWTLVGSQIASIKGLIKHETKPLRIDGCLGNTSYHSISNGTSSQTEDVWLLFRLSLFYYALVGCTIVISVGLIVSHLTEPKKLGDIHPDLLCPLVHRFLPKKDIAVPIQASLENISSSPKAKDLAMEKSELLPKES